MVKIFPRHRLMEVTILGIMTSVLDSYLELTVLQGCHSEEKMSRHYQATWLIRTGPGADNVSHSQAIHCSRKLIHPLFVHSYLHIWNCEKYMREIVRADYPYHLEQVPVP